MPRFREGPALPGALAPAASQQQQQQHRRSGGDPSPQPIRFALAGPRRRGIGDAAPFASLALAGTAAQRESAAQNGFLLLPVSTNRGGHRQQYAWDGTAIKPVNMELLGERYTPAARLLDHLSNLQRSLATSFLPRPEDVTDDYWDWVKWRLGQRFCSAVVLNFATQSLLTAVGVGAQKALAASAIINWMLKDGISRVVRMGVATQWGDAFDADLKRFRYASSLVYSALLSCEFITPYFPGSFLLLASISNVGRAVGLTTSISTQPAFQQALCASGKMADLASKTQAQHMVMDTLALAVCSAANYALRHQEARRRLLPILAFPFFTIADLACIYQELKAVQLRTLNRERGEMVAQTWVDRGTVPTFAEVSEYENLVLPPRLCGNLLPLRILPLERVVRDPGDLDRLLKRHRGDGYMLAVKGAEKPAALGQFWDMVWTRYCTVPHVAVALSEGAAPRDVSLALLHGAYLRRCVMERLEAREHSHHHHYHHHHSISSSSNSSSSKESSSGGRGFLGLWRRRRGDGSGCGADSGGGDRGSDSGEQRRAREAERARERERSARDAATALAGGALSASELADCASEAARLARRAVKRFESEVAAAGWKTQPLLLSPLERAGYSLH